MGAPAPEFFDILKVGASERMPQHLHHSIVFFRSQRMFRLYAQVFRILQKRYRHFIQFPILQNLNLGAIIYLQRGDTRAQVNTPKSRFFT